MVNEVEAVSAGIEEARSDGFMNGKLFGAWTERG